VAELGVKIRWENSGVDEIGIVDDVPCETTSCKVKPGQIVVRVDPRYFRPTEVETLLGDASKAHKKLGWSPRTSFADLVAEMMRSDLEDAKKDELCRNEGFSVLNHHE
jgi:GDPmannose 4,6-dehydratase